MIFGIISRLKQSTSFANFITTGNNPFEMKNAVVTVSNGEYLQGTKVLFHSFMVHNPQFHGDLVVIHNNLALKNRKEISDLFDVRFVQVSLELLKSIEKLVHKENNLKTRHQRFWSLEAFNLSEYSKVLFLDSDILCKGPVNKVFDLKNGFSACPDISFHEGMSRDKITFQKVAAKHGSFQTISEPFNAGVFLICFSELPKNMYSELLGLLNGSIFSGVKSGHTDQYILNLYFENQVNFIGSQYNYLIGRKRGLENIQGIEAHEAKLIHFIRQPKPWELKKAVKNRLKGKRDPLYWSEWHKVYRTVLKLSNQKDYRLRNSLNILISKFLFR